MTRYYSNHLLIKEIEGISHSSSSLQNYALNASAMDPSSFLRISFSRSSNTNIFHTCNLLKVLYPLTCEVLLYQTNIPFLTKAPFIIPFSNGMWTLNVSPKMRNWVYSISLLWNPTKHSSPLKYFEDTCFVNAQMCCKYLPQRT